MPPSEKLKCKLLMPDVDGEGRRDRGNTILRMVGHKTRMLSATICCKAGSG